MELGERLGKCYSGAVYDVLRDMGLPNQVLPPPVFCRYFTPRDIVGAWMVEDFGGSITIGEVLIHSGDYAVADRDGVVIIPAGVAERVAATVEEVMATENLVRKAIRAHQDPQEAYLQYGKF